jgi:hypothetical protein
VILDQQKKKIEILTTEYYQIQNTENNKLIQINQLNHTLHQKENQILHLQKQFDIISRNNPHDNPHDNNFSNTLFQNSQHSLTHEKNMTSSDVNNQQLKILSQEVEENIFFN